MGKILSQIWLKTHEKWVGFRLIITHAKDL
jgi:hypothetical protein